ncbi:mutS protein homolog 4 isoform X1 [Daphnia magna]|uniref:mutS protein homolog 4 isoform X1 n=1 Tax=Daphnia magna TaxID=35525 RepID=UPI001E1BA428|nr:mutS protein homolog 4 isoform X1 [Daphnia magna]
MSSQRTVRHQPSGADGESELSASSLTGAANFPVSATPFSLAGTRRTNNESSFSDNIRRPSSSIHHEGPSAASQWTENDMGSGPTSAKTTNSVFNLRFTSGSTMTSDSHYHQVFAQPSGRAPRSSATPSLFAALTTPGPSRAAAPLRSPLPDVQPQLFGNAGSQPSAHSLPPPSTPLTPGIRGGPPAITPRLTAGRTTVATPSVATPRTGRPRRDDNVIVGLVHGRGFARNEVGMAAINLTACELHLCQMTDSHGFVKTLTKMNLFRPTEVLMPDTALVPGSPSPLAQAISRFDSDIVMTAVNRGAFNDTEGIHCVQKLAVVDHLNILVLIEQKYYALASASALMAHLENNLNITFAPGTLRVYYSGTDKTAIIDSETANRLEVVSSLNPTGGPSLLSALNSCQTAAGKRLLRSNLLEPMTDREAIRQRLDAVEELASRPTDLHQPIKEILSRFVDVERAVNQCVVVPKNPSPSFVEQRINAVVALRHILSLVAPLQAALAKANSPLIVSLAKELATVNDETLLSRIQDVLDERVKPVKGKIGMQRQRFRAVKMGVDLMLDVCRRTHNDLETEMEEYVEDLSQKYQMPLTLANTAVRGYHLQQTLGQARKKGDTNYQPPPPPPELPPVFVCVKKQGNCMAFTTQHLLVSNERIKSVEKDIEKITNVVIEDLLAKTRSDIGSLYKLREIICQLDVIVSFAQVSSAGGFCRPAFANELVIRSGRHPILDQFSPSALVSNDTEMTVESNFHVITGANMSGKSTYIRQVMLLQIMAQIGCFVPASSASFRIVDQMFSRLGTHDRLENNASSFSLEMTEMNYIVRNAGPKSLVIIDELCNETAADQGSAICWSICEALIMTQAWIMIATHTPLVTKLQDLYFNVSNYHMEVLEEEREDGRSKLDYTHAIRPGVTQLENYGMKLACMLAFPPEILSRAKDLIPILTTNLKPLPKTTFDFKMNRLNYALHGKLLDIGRRMDALPDQTFLMEMQRVRDAYKEELNRIMAEHEAE